MINHVVLFKLKKYESLSQKQDVIGSIEEALLCLKDKSSSTEKTSSVLGNLPADVGINYELEAKSYDLCLISHFENIEELDAYRVHPEHLKVVELIGLHAVDRGAVDFEFRSVLFVSI